MDYVHGSEDRHFLFQSLISFLKHLWWVTLLFHSASLERIDLFFLIIFSGIFNLLWRFCLKPEPIIVWKGYWYNILYFCNLSIWLRIRIYVHLQWYLFCYLLVRWVNLVIAFLKRGLFNVHIAFIDFHLQRSLSLWWLKELWLEFLLLCVDGAVREFTFTWLLILIIVILQLLKVFGCHFHLIIRHFWNGSSSRQSNICCSLWRYLLLILRHNHIIILDLRFHHLRYLLWSRFSLFICKVVKEFCCSFFDFFLSFNFVLPC